MFNKEGGRVGVREDLDAAYAMIRDGATDYELLQANPAGFMRYYRGYNAARSVIPLPLVFDRRVALCVGVSRSGKSHFVRFLHKHGARGDAARIWIKGICSEKWFDGYNGQRVALWDDFKGAASLWRLDDFLQLTDPYGNRVQIKHGFYPWNAKYVWFTSNVHPALWWDYGGRTDEYDSVRNRFHAIFLFHTAGKPGIISAIYIEEVERWNWFWNLNPTGGWSARPPPPQPQSQT